MSYHPRIHKSKQNPVGRPAPVIIPGKTGGGRTIFCARYFHDDGIKWRFSLTVVDKSRWAGFKVNGAFQAVESPAPPTIFHQRPNHVTYRNKDGISVVVESEAELAGEEDLYLGFVRFEAPRGKEGELAELLRAFRGPDSAKKPGWTKPEDSDFVATYFGEEIQDRG